MNQVATQVSTDQVEEKLKQEHRHEFLNDVIKGLSAAQKTLSCKYFYDERGSQLFEEITQLDEYYVTRAEINILNQHVIDIAHCLKEQTVVIEPGSGAGIKIQKLLRALNNIKTFIPLEISEEILDHSVTTINKLFPKVKVSPLLGDFTDTNLLKNLTDKTNILESSNIIFFPGSTIGNFNPEQAVQILKNFKLLSGREGRILIGIDLLKDRQQLINAYDDASGITADFNKNILLRINDTLGANFDYQHGFKHQAKFNEQKSRIEMHLVATKKQTIFIDEHEFNFAEGESIHTENSHKYTLESFTEIAKKAGLQFIQSWSDNDKRFALVLLKAV